MQDKRWGQAGMPAGTDQAKVSVIKVLNQVVISVKYWADG